MEFDPFGLSTPAAGGRVPSQPSKATQTQAALRSTPSGAPPTGSNTPLPDHNAQQPVAIGLEGLHWTPAPAQETKEQHEPYCQRTSTCTLPPLRTGCARSHADPWPEQSQSKIPAPEKFSGKKGNAAKSFKLDCKTYFVANASSFPTDDARIMYVLMNLKEGIPKQWGQHYLNKLLGGNQDPVLDSWQAFKSRFLANCDYATEFRVIAGELEWSDSALMAAFRCGLKPFVRSKLIEHTIGRTITSLDDLINIASLIDNTLFEVRKEAQTTSQNSFSSANKPTTGKSAGFVTVEIREKRRKAGQWLPCEELIDVIWGNQAIYIFRDSKSSCNPPLQPLTPVNMYGEVKFI
ncbi:Retrotransposon-derived protein PEG10 [Ceratobasidium sp. AG-Ba]|nr:Retrotransposon-derived protein PEG10 [Ceratobasidium sp. AG-Ba]